MSIPEDRKRDEQRFHDRLRGLQPSDPGYAYYTSNAKFYSITRSSLAYVRNWLRMHCAGRLVLDYGCGEGAMSFLLAEQNARSVGTDISDVSVHKARQEAVRRGLGSTARFLTMDCEQLAFRDSTFDVICVNGVLHHLSLPQAYAELARVVKPCGAVLCVEPLAHNPLFQLYRRRTPHLRTAWEVEHLLTRRDLHLARRYFGRVEVRFFHLATLGAVPFRTSPAFLPALRLTEWCDAMLLRLPLVRWLAWQVVFVLREPRRAQPTPAQLTTAPELRSG